LASLLQSALIDGNLPLVPSKKGLLYVLPVALLIAYIILLPDFLHQSAQSRSDFIHWWSASSMVLRGSSAAVYDETRFAAREKAIAGWDTGYTPFPYPPVYLLIIAPLACLTYLWAQAVWTALSVIGYALVMRTIERRGLLLALAFPGVFLNVIYAQNGLLTLTLLGTGIIYLDRAPVLAGAILGLCSYKPQFAAFIPLFLCITKRWSTLVACAASVSLFCLLSWVAFGWRTWMAFFHSARLARVIILEHGGPGWDKFETLFGAARIWGLSVEASYIIQFSVAAVALCVAVLVWKRSGVLELQASALILATMLLTPHLLEYDVVLLALPIAWLAVDGFRSRFLTGDIIVLAMLWLYPVAMRPLVTRGLPLTPVLLAAGLLVCARRSLYRTQGVRRTGAAIEAQYQVAGAQV
jgi:alpha-1,2-mannosyltransferase